MTVARVAVPLGTVPTLSSFIKHVWRYRDERGHTALAAPPEVFMLTIDDADDALVVSGAIALLSGPLGFRDRVVYRKEPEGASVAFCDLHALHAFLQVLSVHPPDQRSAHEMTEFCLELLGFHWR